jgi:hypothetical protein
MLLDGFEFADGYLIKWFQPFERRENGPSRMIRFVPACPLNNLRERFLGVPTSLHQALIRFQIHRNRFGGHACTYACTCHRVNRIGQPAISNQ